MRAGRGAGCVVKPVRPVGVFGSRNLPGLTLASSRSELRMLMSDSACLSDLKKWTCRGSSPIAQDSWARQSGKLFDVDTRPLTQETDAKQIGGAAKSSFRDQLESATQHLTSSL